MTIKQAISNLADALRADPAITSTHPASVAVRGAMLDHGLTVSSFRIARALCDRFRVPYTLVSRDGLLSSHLGRAA